MIKKTYEVIQNGTLYPYNSFEKNRDGLAQAYEHAEQVLADNPQLDSLEIQFATYDARGSLIACELVDDLINHTN